MNHEPFDEHLSWELRSLVENANPPPTLRPATGARVRHLPRPVILIGSVAAAVLAIAALLATTGSSGPSRQHVASEGSGGHATTTSEEGVVVPVSGLPGVTQTTIANGRSAPTTAPKKSGNPPGPVLVPPKTLPPSTPLSLTRYSLGDLIYFGITTGPDGNMWAVSWLDVARITPTGQVTKFPYRSSINSNGIPAAIVAGPDGNLWFTEWGGDKVGRITPSGTITEFQVPAGESITAGPDGALWFSEVPSGPANGGWATGKNGVGRITTSGQITTYPISENALGITRGSDGNLWFAETSGSKIGRITPAGAITEYPVQHASRGVTLGLDGNVWFQSGPGTAGIGRITPAGQIKEFDEVGGSSWATAITTGPDGNVWCVDQEAGVFRADTSGRVTTFRNSAGYGQQGIASGPGGTLWITDDKGVVVFTPPKG